SQMQCNPLVVKGILYCTSPDLNAFALNAATGEELWRHETATAADSMGANPLRGVVYWEDGEDQRILYTVNSQLIALDARSGKPVVSFGEKGAVDLHAGLPEWSRDSQVIATTPGTVYQDLLIIGSRVSEFKGASPGHIRAFDIRSGELRWVFHTIPQAGEFGADSWPPEALATAGGVNSWAGIAVDPERGIAFVPTGSASFDFYGGDRHGDNLFANSLVALNAATGERIWHYQFIRHDVWDRDLPSPPNLITLRRNGEEIPAVAQATKSGHVFVFHRETGEPLFPMTEMPVVGEPVLGEQVASSQPLPLSPPPFAEQKFIPSTRTPEVAQHIAKHVARLDEHESFRPPSLNGTILYPGMDGGAEWGGMAYDAASNWLYVNANEVPYLLTMAEFTPGAEESPEFAYMMMCAGCHGGDRRGDGVSVPSLVNLSERLNPWEAYRVVTDGRGRMPAFGGMDFIIRAASLWYVFTAEDKGNDLQERPREETVVETQGNFVNAGYQHFSDQEGLPASQPPWGTLTAIDLDNERIAWRIPFGDYPKILEQGQSGLGSENYGGPIITSGGLLFIAATPDRKFKAYDKDTGQLLWSSELPAAGFATPSTYAVDGRQFVVIAAGGGKLGEATGSDYIAYALPANGLYETEDGRSLQAAHESTEIQAAEQNNN
ncbi:MAG: PQQ-binding-like beta-propeller repeat protein, partial [Halioglobus sp.]